MCIRDRDRGYDVLINILGADHAGYIKRITSVVEALSGKKNKLICKVSQLVKLINSSPEKYKLITSCKTHEDVVELAKLWGYEIGKRWGES